MTKQNIKTIDLTPTWTALVPALLDAYANAEPLQRETIQKEFFVMAKAADLGVTYTALNLPEFLVQLAELRRMVPRSNVGEIIAQIDTLRKKLGFD